MHRRSALIGLAGGFAGVLLSRAAEARTDSGADDYPDRRIDFSVPFPAGGGSDLIARTIANALSAKWSKPIVIENRAGGNGIVGTKYVADQPADGYTWLFVTFFHVTNPSLYSSLPYDTVRDFRGVATISKTRYVLVARSGLPANSVSELIALAKAKPGALTYGSAGIGGGVHLAGALFNRTAGTKMLHVPYKGAAELMNDIEGGVVDIAFQTSQVAIPALSGGRVKALAVSGDTRFPALPQVPTFKESGIDYNVQGWFGIAVRSGTPTDIIDKINHDVAVVLQTPEAKKLFDTIEAEPFVSTPSQVDALIKSDIERYGKIIKEENISMKN